MHWVSLSPSPITAFLNAGMSDCPASSQSGTGMNKYSDARTSSVPECSGTGLRYMIRNDDASGIDLDADAQLCPFL
jgi:hypothetical protein